MCRCGEVLLSTLSELCEARTDLRAEEIDHLLRLTASWSLLADLSFSDTVLVTATRGSARRMMVIAQARPNNRATVVNDDLVGDVLEGDQWAHVRLAYESGTRVVGEVHLAGTDGPIPAWCIPVRIRANVVAVLVRLQGPLRGPASLYEQAYLSIFERLCSMVSTGSFPFREDAVGGPGLPRVGDGMLLLDGTGRIEFATPNATSALHRLGVYEASEGRRLDELGVRSRSVERALHYGLPSLEDLEGDVDAAVTMNCVPLVELDVVTGVLVLVRDVSDVRQLNQMVLHREAAIREVHHRVKNNLQTISSLLRLQSRRTSQVETRTALHEAERRVRSIAVVHEVLSREPGEEVVFDEIVRSVVVLVEDTVLTPHPIEIVVNGDLGTLSTDVATPLALCLTEVLTNAVEHGFVDFADPDSTAVGIVTLDLALEGDYAVCEVRDNGRGLDESFSLDVPTSLGLSIVRDVVRSQLHGVIEMTNVDPADGGGTFVRIVVPTEPRA